jgi:hypothetical protein
MNATGMCGGFNCNTWTCPKCDHIIPEGYSAREVAYEEEFCCGKEGDGVKGRLIKEARRYIKEYGFRSAAEIVSHCTAFAYETNLFDKYPEGRTRSPSWIEEIPCDDIHTVEYANKQTEQYRRKDLFYYNPSK